MLITWEEYFLIYTIFNDNMNRLGARRYTYPIYDCSLFYDFWEMNDNIV